MLDGKCVFANRAMLDLLGYSQEEIPLLDWHDLLPDDRPTDHSTTRHLTDLIEGRPAPLEHAGWLRRKNGELATVKLTCQAIDIDNRKGLILSARDIGADPKLAGWHWLPSRLYAVSSLCNSHRIA